MRQYNGNGPCRKNSDLLCSMYGHCEKCAIAREMEAEEAMKENEEHGKTNDEQEGFCVFHPRGVVCGNPTKCSRCGWNPEEARRRSEQIRAERQEKGAEFKGLKIRGKGA